MGGREPSEVTPESLFVGESGGPMLSFDAGYSRDDLLGELLTGPGAFGFWLTCGLDANGGLIPGFSFGKSLGENGFIFSANAFIFVGFKPNPPNDGLGGGCDGCDGCDGADS